MKNRVIKGWRTFDTEPQPAEKKPVFDFVELAKAMTEWKKTA